MAPAVSSDRRLAEPLDETNPFTTSTFQVADIAALTEAMSESGLQLSKVVVRKTLNEADVTEVTYERAVASLAIAPAKPASRLKKVWEIIWPLINLVRWVAFGLGGIVIVMAGSPILAAAADAIRQTLLR
jgi:hypothetical protein